MLTTALCAAALPFVMDPDHGLAVTSRYGGISNPTLYFFSGLVFITSFFATTGFLFGFYSEWCKQRPCVYYHSSSSRWMWVALVLTGFVVMMTATRMMIEGHCCNVDKSGIPRDWTDLTLPTKDVCNRLKVATGIGYVSFVLSVAWSLINMFLTEETSDKMQMADTGVVEVLFALWTFGATWLTFDDVKSPAMDMGNLFFFA